MNIQNIKVGDSVKDTWYFKKWGIGEVTRVLKTRVYIKFSKRDIPIVYDKEHLQFLKKI